MKRLEGVTYVLDEFHLEKYLTKLASHMKDSREDTANELRRAIRNQLMAYEKNGGNMLELVRSQRRNGIKNWKIYRGSQSRHDNASKKCLF